MRIELLNIVICLCLWTVAWGTFAYGLWKRGITYTRKWPWTALYFASVAILTGSIYWKTLGSIVVAHPAVPLLVLVTFMLVQWCLYAYLWKRLPKKREYFEAHPMRDYLLFDPRRLVPKSMDILAQQVFIVLIILFFARAGLMMPLIIVGFCIAFALVHIPPIAFEWGRWPAWSFGGAVVLFSLLFPPLILLVPYGFVYTFIIHWLFYTGTAVIFWARQPKPQVQ